jgi:hypothetical protein
MSKFDVTQIPRFSTGVCDASPTGTCPVGAVHDELSAQITALIRENGQVLGELRSLKGIVEKLDRDNDGLRTEVRDLSREVEGLKASTFPITDGYSKLTTVKKVVFWVGASVISLVVTLAALAAAWEQLRAYFR